MPLRAYIDDEEIISIEKDITQWEELKKRHKKKEFIVTLTCCKQEGFLRTSSKGLRHFVHAKTNKSCDWKPESSEHLKAKIEIIEACKENGWKAIPEFSETNWRADVLATKNYNRIAFEIQWSKQTFVDTIFRQERYKESKIRCCWFFRSAPKELMEFSGQIKANYEIPAFQILKDENSNLAIQLNQKQFSLKSFVSNLLNKKIKFCKHLNIKPKQEVTIVFFDTTCWKCNKTQQLWTIQQNFLSVCDQFWGNLDIGTNWEIYKAVKQFLKTENGKNLKIGQLKYRFSKTVRYSYLSHGCFYCDSIFGNYFLIIQKNIGQYETKYPNHKVEIVFRAGKVEEHHWCYSDKSEFCE